MKRGVAVSTLIMLLVASRLGLGQEAPPVTVGRQPDGRIVVPTNQVLQPAGRQVTFPGRPVDVALADEGRTLIVKNMSSVEFIDVATGRIRQTLELNPGGESSPGFSLKAVLNKPIGDTGKPRPPIPTGFGVVGLLVDGGRVYVTDTNDHLHEARCGADGRYHWHRAIKLDPPAVGGQANPAGIARLDERHLWVATTRGNTVQLVDVILGQVEQEVPVGVAPYTVCVASPDRCYVSNWGGDPPAAGQPQALSSGTPVRVGAKTGIADHGSVSVLAREGDRWRQVRTIAVGLHPCGMARSPSGRQVYVANANSDTVSVIDTHTDEVVETIACRPQGRLPFGSGTNALALSPDGRTLYAANGTNNCVAVVELGERACEPNPPGRASPLSPPAGGRGAGGEGGSSVVGLIPAGWYPGAVAISADGKHLYVANVKGVGALSQPRPVAEGKNSHDWLGSVSLIPVPDERELARLTSLVNDSNRLAYSLAGLEPPRPGVRPVPVPERHGEPSVFKHVIYVIKENRSYDQILGDMKEGDGDPSLVLFGEEVTPNQHALARQFTLFDNFYCSGSLSATGHQWTDEAYVTDYLTKTFGGFVRSYPCDGDDPLAFASSGFLWDNALAHGKTFRNFGEFTRTTLEPKDATWSDVFRDYREHTHRVRIKVEPNVEPMRPYTHPGYPGFPLVTPDVYRAQLFIDELRRWERDGGFPNLIVLFLPANHTVGTKPGFPTPRAMVADNDLALGRVVEAVSHSKFWPETCIFVVEDDPQFGLDHVDGHRTVAQVISPYTRRGFVDHTNYNQTGMVKTIELILGLPPMNQLDLSATAMRACFQEPSDLKPFAAVSNRVPLDEMSPPLDKLRGQARHFAEQSLAMDFHKEDEADEETLNRILWYSVYGDRRPYPRGGARPRDEDDR